MQVNSQFDFQPNSQIQKYKNLKTHNTKYSNKIQIQIQNSNEIYKCIT